MQVELLSWKSIKDIAGEGGIIKTIETEGRGWEKSVREKRVLHHEIVVTVRECRGGWIYGFDGFKGISLEQDHGQFESRILLEFL